MPSDAYNRFYAACAEVNAHEEPEIVVALAMGKVGYKAVEDALIDGTCLNERMFYAIRLGYNAYLMLPEAQERLRKTHTHPSPTIQQQVNELLEARHLSDLWDEEEDHFDDEWPWDDEDEEDSDDYDWDDDEPWTTYDDDARFLGNL